MRVLARAVLPCLAVVGTLVLPTAAHPAATATPKLAVNTTSVIVPTTRLVSVKVTCATKYACRGTLALSGGGATTAAKYYSLASRKSGTYQIQLSPTQFKAVPAGGSKKFSVRVTETKPAAVKTRSVSITLKRAAISTPTPTPTPTPTVEPTPEPPTESRAYRERNWTPTSYDTCPASLHKAHSVIGPDGKVYPTWHGPSDTDPATGQTCTYGHEHGDDPATSDIYTWVTDFLDQDAADSRGIPFGYVSEALDTYAAERDNVTRHEDNVGHKVIVANNIKLVAASPRGYIRDAGGNVVECDFLIKVHQGTHSADALSNNAHELLYAAKCADGTELISSTLTRFGNPNVFNRSCDQVSVTTGGSNLPDGFGGRRVIPDRTCVNSQVLVPSGQNSSIWALYEIWESANRIETTDGDVLVSFDPDFGVRNPARAHDPSGPLPTSILDLIDTSWLVDSTDNGTAHGYPWSEIADHEGHMAKMDPESPFDGAQRDFSLHNTTLDNAGGPTVWWSDPYGDHAQEGAGDGLVRQFVSATDNTAWPDLERRSFDLSKDFGHDNGVHAPN